jgi:AcrR family transcriptional regulator
MSKSGLYAHFGEKQELQLATVEEADRILAEEVMRPATGMAPTVIFREVGIGPRPGGRYWDRTSDLLGVNEALSR